MVDKTPREGTFARFAAGLDEKAKKRNRLGRW